MEYGLQVLLILIFVLKDVNQRTWRKPVWNLQTLCQPAKESQSITFRAPTGMLFLLYETLGFSLFVLLWSVIVQYKCLFNLVSSKQLKKRDGFCLNEKHRVVAMQLVVQIL